MKEVLLPIGTSLKLIRTIKKVQRRLYKWRL